MPLYRYERSGAESTNPKRKCLTRRAPGNVPYVVDNLWEWKRPEGYPNRRYSVFCSPSTELARVNAQDNSGLYRVEPQGNALIVQIMEQDARDHPDCKALKKSLARLLGKKGWLDASLENKKAISSLWAPCLTKEEVEELFLIEPLASIREQIWNLVTFWEKAELIKPGGPLVSNIGEIFFEADEWCLYPLDSM